MPAKTTIKLSWLVLPDEIRHIWYLLHNSTREFCVWGKKLCNYFSTELTKNSDILVHSPFNRVFFTQIIDNSALDVPDGRLVFRQKQMTTSHH